MTPLTHGGKKMFMLLVDDYSRFMWIKLLSSKDGAQHAIKCIRQEADSVSRKKLSALCTDPGGGEFISNAFTEYCNETGMWCQFMAPYSP
jgi:hypothetical protein